jgi:hypothetical protein
MKVIAIDIHRKYIISIKICCFGFTINCQRFCILICYHGYPIREAFGPSSSEIFILEYQRLNGIA